MFDPTAVQDPAPTLGSPTPCAWCGKIFRLQRLAQKFCSSRCQKTGRRSELGAAGARKSRSLDPDTGVGGFSPINSNKINSLQRQKPPPTIAQYRCCRSCGRAFELAATKTTNCPRCNGYVPLPPRKPDGDWFVIAGPVDYCCGCGLAIMPRKPHGFLTPFRGADGDLYCSRECIEPTGSLALSEAVS